LLLVTLSLLLATIVTAQIVGSSEVESAKSLIAMITCGDELGAGIIVGVQDDRLYGITAKHVIRDNTPITVELLGIPSEKFVAQRIFRDESFDLAAFSISDISTKHIFAYKFPFDRVRLNPLLPTSKVCAIGYGNGHKWDSNPPQVFYDMVSILGEQLLFKAAYISRGYSGGGLFDADWRLAGMITEDQPPTAKAISLERIVASLDAIHCPVSLKRPAGGNPSADKSAQLVGKWNPVATDESKNVKSTTGSLTITADPDGATVVKGDFEIEVIRLQSAEVDLARLYKGHFDSKKLSAGKKIIKGPWIFEASGDFSKDDIAYFPNRGPQKTPHHELTCRFEFNEGDDDHLTLAFAQGKVNFVRGN